MIELFWQIWNRRWRELPVHEQAEVLLFPTGPLALDLAARASEEAYSLAPEA